MGHEILKKVEGNNEENSFPSILNHSVKRHVKHQLVPPSQSNQEN